MASIQDTAYPRLKSNLTPKELASIYTPTPEELLLAERVTKGRVAKLGFLILLKIFQRLGYAVIIASVPAGIIQHITSTAHVSTSSKELAGYDTSGTRKRHLSVIRDYLRLEAYSKIAQQVMLQAMEASASTKHDLADLINVAIEELVRQRFELPAFSTMLRAARQVRTAITETFYQQVASSLAREEQIKIDGLFVADSTTTLSTPWNELKQESGKPMLTHLQELVDRLKWLSKLQVGRAVLTGIPEVKVKHFAAVAQTLDASRMKELNPKKRYTLAVALLAVQYTRTLDDITEMFIKRMQQLHHKSKETLAQYRTENQQHTDELVTTLRDLVVAYQIEAEVPQRFTAIETVIGDRSQEILKQCEAHIAYVGNNYFPFLQNFYKSHRATLFRFLEVVPLHSSTQDSSLKDAIRFIQAHCGSRSHWLPTIQIENQDTSEERQNQLLDLSWVPYKWWYLVTGQRHRDPYPPQIDRRHFEVCVFSHILLELKSGDLYIEGSYEFGDYYSQLISWEEYDATVAEYGEVVNLPTASKEFVAHVKQWLESIANVTDQSFPSNTEVDYKKDRLVIRRSKKSISKSLAKLEALITERITPVNLLDTLADTEIWLNWTRFFGPISGYDTKLDNPVARYLATTFCYGCNIGPSQTARSLSNFDRRQISWVSQRHITEDNLQEAIFLIINAYNRFVLPKFWGSGKHASADGTKWDIYEQNLLAEYHIRYGGYGGIGYYHVSDIAFLM